MHGRNNLDKAIDLLDNKIRRILENLLIARFHLIPQLVYMQVKHLLTSYYNEIFPWLKNCEKLFGFEGLKGYDLTRIYGFLAERFMSYWFKTQSLKTSIYSTI